MILLRRDPSRCFSESSALAGTWIRWLYLPGRVTAALRCPSCGRVFCLAEHRIATDGRVSPSVVCPYPPCAFHVFMKLEGWDESS
jgi:hypothetical protein